MNLPSFTSLLIGKQYIGIEHFSLKNEEKTAIILIEKKNEELIITQKDKVSYTKQLAEKWNRKLPYFLVINTNQIIQKEIDSTDSNDEKLLHKAFPNTNLGEFYFEIYRLEERSIVAISRKSYIDDLLTDYRKQEIYVAGLSLGVNTLSEITNYTDQGVLFTNHQIISFQGDTPIIKTTSKHLENTYTINGLRIKNDQILAFGGILRLLLGATLNSGNTIVFSQKIYEDYTQKSFFSKAIKLMIGFLLTILLINFFVFSHYYTLEQQTSESLILNKSSLENITNIKKRIQTKELKVKAAIEMTSSQSSLIINEITKKIPQSILLTEIIYHPLEKKIKEDESITIKEKTITVSGITVNNEAFTEWIEKIEKLNWINTVVITNYGVNDINQTDFSVKIILK